MASPRNSICIHKLHHLLLSFLFLFLFISSWTQLKFIADGRTIFRPVDHSWEEKPIMNVEIGSKPPQCERRCSSCGHCEAIQVPTNPQIKSGTKRSSSMSGVDYARGDGSSNYKPMSWKCKCGNSIFNP